MNTSQDSIKRLRELGISRNRLAKAVGMAPEYLSTVTSGKQGGSQVLRVLLHVLVSCKKARKMVGL